MGVRPLLPDLQALGCEEVTSTVELVLIHVNSASAATSCPLCQ